MRGNKNILKKGKIGTACKMHVKGKVRRKSSKKITSISVRVSQCCFNWVQYFLSSFRFKLQVKIVFLFSAHTFFFLFSGKLINVILFMPGILGVISYGLESMYLSCVESLGDSQDLNWKVYNQIWLLYSKCISCNL